MKINMYADNPNLFSNQSLFNVQQQKNLNHKFLIPFHTDAHQLFKNGILNESDVVLVNGQPQMHAKLAVISQAGAALRDTFSGLQNGRVKEIQK